MCDIQTMKELQDIDNECLSSNSESSGVYNAAGPTLLSMPVEIILKICTFLDAYFIKHTFSKVCARFADILADDSLWKYWVYNKMGGCYPTLPNLKIWEDISVDWEGVCVQMDVEEKKWTNVKDTIRHIVIKDVHYASVDTVLLINNGEMCISGGRDRGVALWNIRDLKPHDDWDNTTSFVDAKPHHNRINAHSGWVWDLAADDLNNATLIYSASWDSTVRAWDLASGFNCVEAFRCSTSALSVAARDNTVMAGLYSKKILMFDLRAGSSHVNSYKPHKGPVLALEAFDNKLASVSEDKTLAVWDFVAGKLLKSDIKMPTDVAYPVCISWSPQAMYVGDSKGSLHVIHPQDHTYIRTHRIWALDSERANKIMGCHHNQGNLILSSDKGEIKFFYNCYPPKEYSCLKTSTYDATQLRYQNGVLCIGTCDSALEFWVPNDRYSEL